MMVYRWMSAGLVALLCVTALMPIDAQGDDVAKKAPAATEAAAAKDAAAATEAAADDSAATAVRPFAEVSAEFEAVDKSLADLAAKYRAAPPTERQAIIDEYQVLVKKSQALLPELRSAAITAYKAAPNADEKLTKLMVGLLANDVRSDLYADALELGNLLLKNNCPEPAVDGLVGAAAYCSDDFETASVHLQKAKAANAISEEADRYLMDVEQAKKVWVQEQKIRQAEAKADDLPRVKLETSKGDVVVELMENEAPKAVGNFVNLVEKKYYDGLTFHRVLPGFMAQGGCPEGTGSGGPGYMIPCECQQENHRNHFRGTLSMAHAGKDTGGSQFFLTFRRTSHLDGAHTVFGRVIEGMDVLAKLQRRDPNRRGQPEPDKIVKAEVLRKRDHEYVPTKAGE